MSTPLSPERKKLLDDYIANRAAQEAADQRRASMPAAYAKMMLVASMPLVAWGCNQGYGFPIMLSIGFGVVAGGFLIGKRIEFWANTLTSDQK